MQVNFKAKGWKGEDGVVKFIVMDNPIGVRDFFSMSQAHEKKTGEYHPIEVTLQAWYKKRSLNQLRLHWQLCQRLASVDKQDPDVVHEAMKHLYYPHMQSHGTSIPKPSRLHTTVEFAQITERIVQECMESGAFIKDIWILWTEWRYGQEVDPLEGTYSSLEDYREKHPCCEACGVYLRGDLYGSTRGELAHIVSRGSGGSDKTGNLFHLCVTCHRLQHQKGWEELLKSYSHLKQAVNKAREYHGATG